MSLPSPRICLVTPGHLASTPRLVKNADALCAAGYRVHVVANRYFGPAEPLDARITENARWTFERIDTRPGPQGLARSIQREIARRFLRLAGGATAVAARAQHAAYVPLVAAASRTRADFFFGHGGVAGLAVAAAAARRCGVSFGFDAEDWHEEETLNNPAAPAVRALLRSLLPKALLVTCAAPLIGAAFTRVYGVSPICLLNVFPLSHAPASPARLPAPSGDTPAVFYWFSQTIGPGRGLEDFIQVLARLRTPAELHLRGFPQSGYLDALQAAARTAGFRGRILFLPPAAADEMVRLSASAHVGLSLEQSVPKNRDLCLTNKLFTYLLAGVPVMLTPTTAQSQFAPVLDNAARILAPCPVAAAKDLDAWLASSVYPAARQTAWDVARETFNWEREQSKLIAAFATLPLRPRSGSR